MTNRNVIAKELKVGDIVALGEINRKIKYVDIGPKSVYIKTLSGKSLSFPSETVLSVV